MNAEDVSKPDGKMILYREQELSQPIRVVMEGESVWLTQRLMADLYGTTVANISSHILSIYDDGELSPEATIKKYLIVQQEGKRQVRRLIDHYNLDMIIAVGYRVHSPRGVQFRQWATERLHEYLVKGFTLDDRRLKGRAGVTDYFDELLERIRDIRAGEARVYLTIRNIYALACDYRKDGNDTNLFFSIMQNKMLYAATGKTAAEIVNTRAQANSPNMGLTSWKGGHVIKADVGTAKNYLNDTEIDTLNRITVMFLDQAEFRAKRRLNIYMADWETFLDHFLREVELPLLEGSGSMSHEEALKYAHSQYDLFEERRREERLEEADARFLEDLRTTAETIEKGRRAHRTKPL